MRRTLCLILGVAVWAAALFGCSSSAEPAQGVVSTSVTESLLPATDDGRKLYYSVTLRNNTGKPLEVDRVEPVFKQEISESANGPAPAQPIGRTIAASEEWVIEGEIIVNPNSVRLPLGECLQGVRVYFRDGTSLFVET